MFCPDWHVVGVHESDLLRLLERNLQKRVHGDQEDLLQDPPMRQHQVGLLQKLLFKYGLFVYFNSVLKLPQTFYILPKVAKFCLIWSHCLKATTTTQSS